MNDVIAKSVPLNREQQIREAALLIFCDPLPEKILLLPEISNGEWKRLLRWLDISGLALYFLDRLRELQLIDVLPREIFTRLQQNLANNAERMRGMIAESIAIQNEFQSAHLSYAVLKGFSLWPMSVPKLELRSQLDLDFLIADKCVSRAQRILEHRGYVLHAVSGRSWEFKTRHLPSDSLDDLYKDVPGRCAELHVESNVKGQRSLLANTEARCIDGFKMPVLQSSDLLLGQGLHLFKHVYSDFSRSAHLLEFRKHVLARRNDEGFWEDVQAAASENPTAHLGLGVATLLITRVMGDFAPEALTSWTVDRLPVAARLWIDLYGQRTVLVNFPGNKLYLLLQRELENAGVPAKRPIRRALVPLKLPPRVSYPRVDETADERIRRNAMELRFILSRLRFHLVEGMRYVWESRRWRREMNRKIRLEPSHAGSSPALPQLPDAHAAVRSGRGAGAI